jgi:hypothetical protein
MLELVAVVLLAGFAAAVEKDVGQCDCTDEGVLAGRHRWWSGYRIGQNRVGCVQYSS